MTQYDLPPAILKERMQMLENTVHVLEDEGYEIEGVEDLGGYPDPKDLQIPVWNTPMRPDVLGRGDQGEPVIAVVETSTCFGEESCGRRWQAFLRWVQDHGGELRVYVHPEDKPRAEEVARHWHVEPSYIRELPRNQGSIHRA